MYPGMAAGYIPSAYLKRNNITTVTHVDLQDRNFHGIRGAREILGILKKRPSVTQVTLSQNELGDEGVHVVLQYLIHNSPSLSITSLSLNCCKLGNSALGELGSYIKKYAGTLQNISLQNNVFTGDPETLLHFTQCLNSSSISKLDLGRNPQAGDDFLAHFLPHLDAPHLEHLNLSAMNLTPASHGIILAYLSSPASRPLRIFECNGNRLTRPFADALIHCLWTGNYWLKHIRLHGNLLNSMTLPGEESTQSSAPPVGPNPGEEEVMKPWPACEKDMEYALHRNQLAGDFAANAAVKLLPYARILALQLGVPSRVAVLEEPWCNMPPPAPLPFELKALILNELAPSLSLIQCHRIIKYISQGFANAAKTKQDFLKRVQCDVFEPNSVGDVLRALSSINTGRITLAHGTDLSTFPTFG